MVVGVIVKIDGLFSPDEQYCPGNGDGGHDYEQRRVD
jgi:hypothetical protein